MSGVGKTQIAVQFAYTHRLAYDFVFWVRGGTRESVRSDLVRIAATLLDSKTIEEIIEESRGDVHTGESTIIDRLAKTLSQCTGTGLFIFDNIEDPLELREFIPMCAQAATFTSHILITSCNQSILSTPELDDGLEVTALSLDEALEFLEKRLLRHIVNRQEIHRTEGNELLQLLGCLPLALEHSVAYIRTTQCTIKHYIEIFEIDNDRKELMSSVSEAVQMGLPFLELKAISYTWDISLRHLQKHHPSSVGLFNVLALFDGTGVPERLLRTGLPDTAEEPTQSVFWSDVPEFAELVCNPTFSSPLDWRLDNHLYYDTALAHLLSFSFIRRLSDESEILWVHPLLRQFGVDRLAISELRYWAQIAIKILHRALTSPAYDFQSYVRHADTCIEIAEQHKIEITELSVIRHHAELGYDLSYWEMQRLSQERSLETWRGTMSSLDQSSRAVPVCSGTANSGSGGSDQSRTVRPSYLYLLLTCTER